LSAEHLTRKTPTEEMTIESVLSRLAASDFVDGLALYGPRGTQPREPEIDYDLLVLVNDHPMQMTQLFTRIDRRVADVLFVDVMTYDQVIEGRRRVSTSSTEGVFLLKMRRAEIIHDRSRRFEKGRKAASHYLDWFRVPSYSGQYLLWFSQNFGLAHMRRMIQSTDPTYLTAVDLMIVSYLGATCRAYFDFRQLPWEGEKAAIRYLRQHDPDYLQLLGDCLSAANREQKLALYGKLVTRALEPFGEIWKDDVTAACLGIPVQGQAQVGGALDFWERLFC
jgi:hypothetical protein